MDVSRMGRAESGDEERVVRMERARAGSVLCMAAKRALTMRGEVAARSGRVSEGYAVASADAIAGKAGAFGAEAMVARSEIWAWGVGRVAERSAREARKASTWGWNWR